MTNGSNIPGQLRLTIDSRYIGEVLGPAVCVDHGMAWPATKRWPYGWVAHLFVCGPEHLGLLHEMARELCLSRSWFQGGASLPHYDLTRRMHHRAVTAGAILIARRELGEVLMHWGRLRKEGWTL